MEMSGFLRQDVSSLDDLLHLLDRSGIHQHSALVLLGIRQLHRIRMVTDILEIRLLGELLFTNAQQMPENHDMQHRHRPPVRSPDGPWA